MTELFQKDRTVIGRHINNIYKEQELKRETTCANFAHTKNYGYREDCGGESCHAALPRDEKKHSFSNGNKRHCQQYPRSSQANISVNSKNGKDNNKDR